MQVPIRSYLTAGMSFVAVGAIIATPMSPLEPKQVPSHRLADDQQVHLAVLAAPISIHGPADNPQAVHVLADVSRALHAVKTANATSTFGGTSASPSAGQATVPRLAGAATIPALTKAAQAGAATTQDPETAYTPGAAGGQPLDPRSAAVNAFDPSAVGNVLTSAGKLLVDVDIELPLHILEATAVNFDAFLHDAASHPFDLVGALSRFLSTEASSINQIGDVFSSIASDDTNELQNAIGAVFGASPVSGVVDNTTANGQQGLDPSSKGVVTAKHSQDGSAKPARVNAPGHEGDTVQAKQSGTETKAQSPAHSTDITKGDTAKGDDTSGQPTSTPTSHLHRSVSSTANGGTTEDKGASKTKGSKNTASHAAGTGRHRATKDGHSGHGGRASK